MSIPRRATVADGNAVRRPPAGVLEDDVVLLAGKTAPPDLGRGLVARPRLAAMLTRGIHAAPVTLVSGPAGSGKTVFTAFWFRSRPGSAPAAWLTLDENDDDPATFWTYFIESLAQAGVDLARVPRPGAGDPLPRSLIPRLAAQLLARPRPVVLVLDNSDSLTHRAILDNLDLLLQHTGGRLRLVVCARADPQLPLHAYRVAGTLSEIRSDDVAFTPEETRELFAALGVPVTVEAAAMLCAETEGWAVGLRLAAAPLKQGVDPARLATSLAHDDGSVAQYLLAEVLRDQPATVRRFLLRMSVTDELWPDLVRRLTGRPNSHNYLASLARANAFVDHVPGAPGDYRIHPLFREMLRAQLSYELPREVAQLHRTCAAWYAGVGRPGPAATHAAEAGDWAFAAELMMDELLVGHLLTHEPDAIALAMEPLPANVPGRAAAVTRIALAVSSRRAPGESDLAEAARAAADPAERPTVRMSAEVSGVAAGAASGRALDGHWEPDRAQLLIDAPSIDHDAGRRELAAVLTTSRALLELSGDDGADHILADLHAATAAASAVGSRRLRAQAEGFLALLEAVAGRLDHASRVAANAEAISAERRRPDREGSAAVATALAWVSASRYELGEAREWMARARERAATAPEPFTGPVVAVLQSRLLRLRHEYAKAEDALRPHLDERIPAWLRPLVVGEAVESALAHGDVPGARAALDKHDDGTSWSLSSRSAIELQTPGRAPMPRPALGIDDDRSPATVIAGGIVRTCQLLDAGAGPAATAELRTALQIAEPQRLRWPFLDAPPQVRRLLRTSAQLRAPGAWLNPAAGGAPTAASPAEPRWTGETVSSVAPQDLSERELEVLTHLSEMLSTAEIAATMFISVNTVRTHIRSILRKLAVTRRNQAVRRARELHIL